MSEKDILSEIGSLNSLWEWAARLQNEIDEITTSLIPLQQQRDAAVAKLELVRRLINLSNQEREQVSSSESLPSAETQPVATMQLEDRVEAMLSSQGKPMHIRDIYDNLIKLGVPMPGKGQEANIILRLRRDSNRFVRTGRGTYALVAWKLPTYTPTKKRRKVRGRKVEGK